MKHSFIDEYSVMNSFIHKLDPRTKIIASLAYITAVVLTPASNWKAFAVYLCIIAVLLWLSRLPTRYVLKRSLVIFPFVIMIAVFIPFFREGQEVFGYQIGLWRITVTYEGLTVFLSVVIKSWLCMLCLIILTSATKFADLLQGMRRLKVPQVFIQIIAFMYRYIFVLADQAMRMQMARDSRSFGLRRGINFKTLGNMVGMLFIRSYERGERVYAAMLARAYSGEIPVARKLHFEQSDAFFSLALMILLVSPAVFW